MYPITCITIRICAVTYYKIIEGNIIDIRSPDAVAHLGGHLWSRAYDPNAPLRDARQTWLDVSRAAGLLADPRDGGGNVPEGGVQINITKDIAAKLIDKLTPTGGGSE